MQHAHPPSTIDLKCTLKFEEKGTDAAMHKSTSLKFLAVCTILAISKENRKFS